MTTLISEQLLEANAWGLDDKAQFLVAHGVGSLLVPLLFGFAVTSVMRFLAHQAKKWCNENPDQPLSTEVISMLPSALEGPTVTTVWTMVVLR